jgi:DMSO/TMAO reductase YedYZ heme-binding membrane subunit
VPRVTSQIWWWVARSSGMVAAVLIALTLVWGLLLTTKVIPRKGLPAWLTDMHRMLGGLSVLFIGVHLLALFLDSYAHFAWSELFVPFQSAYRAGAVAWGIGAFWMLLVVEGTSLLQRRMPRRVWRGLHYLSYPVAVMVAIHAMTAGTDSGNAVFRITTFGLMALLTALTAYRFALSRRGGARGRSRPGTLDRPDRAPSPSTAPVPTAPVPTAPVPTAPVPAPFPASGSYSAVGDMFAPPAAPPPPSPSPLAAPTPVGARPAPHPAGPASDPSTEVR